MKKRLVVGILAHVDAGKTTLSEAFLYTAGKLRKLGRVDHGDAFLDTDEVERERGITIYSKEARFEVGDTEIVLADTPGHVDFSAETERVLQVLDCAVLVVSATDGVQAHTRTLSKLLDRYGVPTFIFVNKTDLPFAGEQAVADGIRKDLGESATPFFSEENDGRERTDTADLKKKTYSRFFRLGKNGGRRGGISERARIARPETGIRPRRFRRENIQDSARRKCQTDIYENYGRRAECARRCEI